MVPSPEEGGIEWVGAPSFERGRLIEVLSPRPGRPVSVYLLSERIEGVYIHYMPTLGKGRTRPCVGKTSGCVGCSTRISRRWKGFLASVNAINGRLCIAEVTAEAARGCPAICDGSSSLRGKRLDLCRRGPAPNSPVLATLVEVRLTKPLPESFPLREQLTRIWGVEL